MDRKGIARVDIVVIYRRQEEVVGGHALWVLAPFGHEDVRLLNGGRDLWISESLDTTLDRLSRGHRRGLAMSALLGPTVTELVGPTLVALTIE